ncbi:anoctamin-9-like isoform X1 [Xiphophorus hellerii]|uniref:anoctamin-9-like isoform X1 n=2 Tax=Xiphophorus hellerii TaxID=8084 RepID=UPI0013B3CB23|nr:anoctamin-9-like isoform X1 [Xiphophorus hellerii]
MYFKNTEDKMELQEREDDDQSDEAFLPSLFVHTTFDFLLVAIKQEPHTQKFHKQEEFLEELKKKNIAITSIDHEDKIFLGLRAPDEIFEDYQYLIKVSDACSWCKDENSITQANRIRIVHFILNNTCISTKENLEKLTLEGVFETMFCLHEKKEQKNLRAKWARWSALFTPQPFDEIKCYFGEKVALYYLWLNWYTILLIPAAALGAVIFLYGLAFFNTSPLIKEVCDSNVTMCPSCDRVCEPRQLSETCTYAKVSHLFDNEGTVAFAMFMAVWATAFLEFWQRHRARYASKWKVYDWCEEEEELIMEIVNDINCEVKEFKHSYFQSTLVLILFTAMLMVIIGITHALVVFRVMTASWFSRSESDFLEEKASMLAMLLGAVLHYFTIQIMNRVNRWVSLKLCDLEKLNSLAAKERSFTVKMFTFQFFTLFSSLFYVAFFLGRINGHPTNYVRLAGFRLEECHPSGCLTDLFIQMAVIMLLKQTLNNVLELLVPWAMSFLRKKTARRLKRQCGKCYRKFCRNKQGLVDACDICKKRDWLRNYHLGNTDAFSLFNEFLEMVIQFSFTTTFVAAFPLAPLLALLNNIIEIRLDAIKMVRYERRLIPRKTSDIGIWTKVLEVVGVFAVIVNALVIGISSDFIPRLVYHYHYGPCAKGIDSTHCMQGYINDTLSVAFMKTNIKDEYMLKTNDYANVTQCSYRDYRNQDYSLTSQFWLVLAIRFAFIILFEHVVVVCKFIAAWFVPEKPVKVKNSRLNDKMDRFKSELRDRKLERPKSTEV